MIQILDIKKYDVLNGPGTRLSIWLAGCANACPGCWAKSTWNHNQGTSFLERKNDIKELVADPHINGVSLLGGDPLYTIMVSEEMRAEHWDELMELLNICSQKPVWVWTGYTIQEIQETLGNRADELFSHISYIVEGRFMQAHRDLNLTWRGSANQRIYKCHDGQFEDVTNLADSGKLVWEN